MTYKAEIIRSNRKSISISISSDNKITVRCPEFMSDSRVNKYLNLKQNWIEKVIKSNAEKLYGNERIVDYKEILVGGNRVPIVVSDFKGILPDAVYVRKLTDIKGLFVKHFSCDFIKFAEELAETFNLPAKEFIIKSYKSRWGCCDRNGNISFNWLLLMLPKELQRYVIVHELCHTKVFNHSQTFWSLVEKCEPDYKELRKRLKNYTFLIGLY